MSRTFDHSDFEFVSSFDIRISDFEVVGFDENSFHEDERKWK